jgi:phosphopantothenoylcysteine decarboxylase/phosphopantothenate--cysteine ligase
VIASAAVSDWRPAQTFAFKVKKSSRPSAVWAIPFISNPDILRDLSRLRKRPRVLVGFALETQNLLRNARRKLKEKNLDLIVANSPAAFGKKRSAAVLMEAGGKVRRFAPADKSATAKRILDIVEQKLELR